jgi:hypothetical protein
MGISFFIPPLLALPGRHPGTERSFPPRIKDQSEERASAADQIDALSPGIFQQIDGSCLSRKEQDFAHGELRPHLDRNIDPGNACVATSDMSRSGAFDPAAVNASCEQVKNFAEKPFIFRIAARVEVIR